MSHGYGKMYSDVLSAATGVYNRVVSGNARIKQVSNEYEKRVPVIPNEWKSAAALAGVAYLTRNPYGYWQAGNQISRGIAGMATRKFGYGVVNALEGRRWTPVQRVYGSRSFGGKPRYKRRIFRRKFRRYKIKKRSYY